MRASIKKVFATRNFWLVLLLAFVVAGCGKYPGVKDPDQTTELQYAQTVAKVTGKKLVTAPADTKSRCLLIRVGQGTARYTLIGSQGVKAGTLGDELSKAVAGLRGIQEVRASSLDQPLAVAKQRFAQPFMLSWSADIDVDRVISKLDLGPNGWVAVRVSEATKVLTPGLKEVATAESHRVLVPLPGEKPSIVASEALGAPGWWALVWVILAPWTVLTGPLLGWIAWRFCRKSLIAYAWVAYPSSLIAAVLFAFLQGPLGKIGVGFPLATWFGLSVRGTSYFGFFLAAPIFCALLQARLQTGTDKPSWLTLQRFGPGFAGVLLSLLYGDAFFFNSNQPTFMLFIWVLLTPLLASSLSGTRGQLQERWTERARVLAERMDMPAPEVHSWNGSVWDVTSSVQGTEGAIKLSSGALINMEPAEADFLLAREMYRMKIRVPTKAWPGWLKFVTGAAIGLSFSSIGANESNWLWSLIVFGVMVVVMFAVLVRMDVKTTAVEQSLDAKALAITRDLDAAVSAIKKTKGYVDRPGKKMSRELARRIASLESASRNLAD